MDYSYLLSQGTLEVQRDLLNEAVIDDNSKCTEPQVECLDQLFTHHGNINLLTLLHYSLKECNPLSRVVAERLLHTAMKGANEIDRQYYYYLQKTASIIDLYQTIIAEQVDGFDNVQLLVITIHKIQNLNSIGLQLLLHPPHGSMQLLVYEDMLMYNKLIKQELSIIIESFAIQSTSITLSLYQIYSDLLIQDSELLEYQRNSNNPKLPIPVKLEISDALLTDFLTFSSSLTLMNSKVMKPLNIPTKTMPCGGREAQVLKQYRKFHSMYQFDN